MAGEWESDDLAGLLTLLADNIERFKRLMEGGVLGKAINWMRHLSRSNTRKGSRRNILAHYDLGNRFYETWLDGSMTYSSAIYDARVRDLESGKLVIFAGGTGNPFFTTDTTAALRAAEMGCDVILKATQVDGVYSADPKKDPSAVRYSRLTYDEALSRDLKVMDGAAFALARDTRIPIVVFSIEAEGSISRVLAGEGVSTLVERI
ncbi:MAG: hypothetical protein HC869_14700 [Rhodospirillales bacterium]|nr:hypothetical protein [Rhodospirillales bacterium]